MKTTFMKVHQIYTNSPLRNFTYVLISNDRKSVLCIDPFDANQIINFLEKQNLKLTHIINTHEHFDHICGNEGLVDRYKARVYAHPGAEKIIPNFDEALCENNVFEFEGAKLRILETPGHTPLHISLMLQINGKDFAVFSGDTVFNAGVGNCFNGGDVVKMYETIESKYDSIDNSVLLYPGHDYLFNNLNFTLKYEPGNKVAKKLLEKFSQSNDFGKTKFMQSTIGLERDISLFFRLENESIRESLYAQEGLHKNDADPKSVFVKLRSLRDHW